MVKRSKKGEVFMYGQEENTREQIIEEYQDEALKLLRYLPWLSKKKGSDVSTMFTGDAENKVIPIPVFDSTLLAFVKEAEKTKFMDRNYPYVYSRNHISSHEDEIRLLKNAKITDMKIIKGILSKYILGGKTKANLWTEGVESHVIFEALDALNRLLFSNTSDGKQMIRY